LGSELINFGYDKNIGPRQVKRLVREFEELGLIEKERSTSHYMSVNRYVTTQFGVDVYNYIINNNLGLAKIRLLEARNDMQQKAPENIGLEKNVPKNIPPLIKEKDMDMGLSRRDNTRWVNESSTQTNETVPDVPVVPWRSKLDLNAKPIDLDDPEWILSSREPDRNLYRHSDGTMGTIQLFRPGAVPRAEPVRSNVHQLQPRDKPELSAEKLSKNFRGPELDMLNEILTFCNRDEAAKLCFVTSMVEVVVKIRSEGRKVMNFSSLARAISKKVLNFDHVLSSNGSR
jgi:hypothetical protein